MVLIRLDTRSGEPIWRQIVAQVKYAVAAGELAAGEQLPSIRALAGELKVNPRTVVKAYEELRNLGLVVLKQGRGAFVTERGAGAPTAVRRKVLRDLVQRLLAESARLGGTPAETSEILDEVVKEMEKRDA